MTNPYAPKSRGPKWEKAAAEDRTGLRRRLEGTDVGVASEGLTDLHAIARDHRDEVGAGATIAKLLLARLRNRFRGAAPGRAAPRP